MFKMEAQSKKLWNVLCVTVSIYAADLSVYYWLFSIQFASVIQKGSGQLPPQLLLCIIIVWFK